MKNASLALLQTVFSIFSLFYSYKLILQYVGVENLGLWALIVSIASMSRISELGLSGSVLKYVSGYLAKLENKKAILAVNTSTTSVGILVAITMIVFYLPMEKVILYILKEDSIYFENQFILLLALLSSWFAAIAGVSKLSLEGCQRYDYSTLSAISSTIVFVISVLYLVPTLGITGLAIASVLQWLVLFLTCRFFLKRSINGMPFLSCDFSLNSWKSLVNYGLQFQIISLVKIFLEPLTKGLLGKYGDITAVGFYELASKFATQMRRLLVAMNQVLIPKVSEFQAKGVLNVKEIYRKNFKLVLFISVYFFTGLLCIVPFIETYWFGQRELQFQLFSIIAVTAFFLNTISIPAYMMNLGTGKLSNNVVSHALMGIVNIVLGVILGSLYGATGVVLSWGLALAAGTIPILAPFHRRNQIRLGELIGKFDILGLVLSILGVVIYWYCYYSIFNGSTYYVHIGTLTIVLAIFFVIPVWLSPYKSDFLTRISNFLSKNIGSTTNVK